MRDKKILQKKARDFLEKNSTAVIATVSKDGTPQAATIFYVIEKEFELYFMTLSSTRKYTNLLSNSKVAFVVGTTDTIAMTVQIEGVAELVTNYKEQARILMQLAEVANRGGVLWPPISKIPGKKYAVFHLSPTWIRCLETLDTMGGQGSEHIPFEQVLP